MTRFSLRFASILGALVLLSNVAFAQPGGDRAIVDGVAAFVGSEVILYSDIQQSMIAKMRAGEKLDLSDTAAQRRALQELIDERLVLTKAREDSMAVDSERVEQAVDAQYQEYLRLCKGSVSCVEQQIGMSIDRIRVELRHLLEQKFLMQAAVQRRLATVKATDDDLRRFFTLYADSLPRVPEQLEIQRIVLLATPGPDAKARTMVFAQKLIDSIRAGGDFADFARRWSTDPGSASNGGDVGYVRPGQFVKEYENAARALAVGEISPPVESSYGIHIIQVLDRRGDETRSRHILLPLRLDEAGRDSLMARLRKLRDRARAGEDFAALARAESQDQETRGLGGNVGRVPADKLSPDQRAAFGSQIVEGSISEPLPYSTGTQAGYQILRVVRRIPEHRADLSQDREQIEPLALQFKRSEVLKQWFDELRREVYWEVKAPL